MLLRFCELFLGDNRLAEQAATEALVRFFRAGRVAEANGIPVALLSVAFRVASQSRAVNSESAEPLQAAIAHLDFPGRAAFILHGVMSVQLPWVAAIIGVPLGQAKRLWADALVQIRERLPQDFFKEQQR
jgi:DNA-directed RNA polymerase specialized sigma24 family protein